MTEQLAREADRETAVFPALPPLVEQFRCREDGSPRDTIENAYQGVLCTSDDEHRSVLQDRRRMRVTGRVERAGECETIALWSEQRTIGTGDRAAPEERTGSNSEAPCCQHRTVVSQARRVCGER